MKRILWVTCLGCMSALPMIGCGGSGGGGEVAEDGGVDSITQINDNIDQINGQVGDLGDNVDQLNTTVDDLKSTVDDANNTLGDLSDRVAKLEDPTIPHCSDNESAPNCTPDGVDVVQADLQDVIQAVCESEVNCCTADERTWNWGAGIQSADDCVQTVLDLIGNGISPNLLSNQRAVVVENIIEIAQALNDARVKVEIDKDAVAACVEAIGKGACPTYTDLSESDPLDHCTASPAAEQDPCSLDQLVNGLQEEGEICGIGGPYVPECKDGLVCRHTSGSNEGICAQAAAATDGCTSDSECDTDLFCNHASGKCQDLADAGEPCAYIDPSFTVEETDLNPINYDQRSATSVDCKPGLSCDPKSKKCVAQCSSGSFCYAYNGNTDCPDKTVCNVTENPGLYETWTEGVCRAATAAGKPCTLGSECASGACDLDPAKTDGSMICQAAKKAAGTACDVAGQADETCQSGLCDNAGKCATPCTYDDTAGSYSCASGTYCDPTQSILNPTGAPYACEPKGDAGDGCSPSDFDGSQASDSACKSGFCDVANGSTCQPKVAAGGTCASGRDAECPSTQWCDTSNSDTCTDFLALDADCSTTTDYACGPGNYCLYDGSSSYACKALGDVGDDCSGYAQCKSGLSCNGQDAKCYEPYSYPNGASCSYDDDCSSGWCSAIDINTQYGTCAAKIADGADCDDADPAQNRCVDSDYCKYPEGSTAGKCAARLSAGQKCTPRFGGKDCLNSYDPLGPGNCQLRNDLFLCDTLAHAPDELFCDGE